MIARNCRRTGPSRSIVRRSEEGNPHRIVSIRNSKGLSHRVNHCFSCPTITGTTSLTSTVKRITRRAA